MTTGVEQHGTTARGRFEFAIGDELRGERATMGRSLLDVQRDLRIKAAYVAAIENADASVFPNPSFIPGYVRSYARYLGRDPEEVYARFCAESGFAGPAAAQQDRARRAAAASGAAVARPAGVFRPDFPMAARPRRFAVPSLPVSAIGSVLVLVLLVAGLGYGGWTVLLNIQRVQFAPVEELPLTLSSVAALPAPAAADPAQPALSELAQPVAAAALTDLYRRQELEVPILVPRDGPIAGLDPDRVGLHAAAGPGAGSVAGSAAAEAPAAAGGQATVAAVDPLAAAALAGTDPLLAAPPEAPPLTVVAERAAWIRVYLADKTVIFERILETGESYSPPTDVAEPLIWAGNSGSVYVRLDGALRGPLGSGTRAVRDVALEPKAIAARYAVVEDVPEALSEASAPAIEAAAIAIQ